MDIITNCKMSDKDVKDITNLLREYKQGTCDQSNILNLFDKYIDIAFKKGISFEMGDK